MQTGVLGCIVYTDSVLGITVHERQKRRVGHMERLLFKLHTVHCMWDFCYTQGWGQDSSSPAKAAHSTGSDEGLGLLAQQRKECI